VEVIKMAEYCNGNISEVAVIQGPGESSLEGKCAESVAEMERQGRIVQVVGRVIDGRVEIDHAALEELASRFPGANMSFVAVNAPFDPGTGVPACSTGA
jgi:hypothetical protein